MAERGSRPPATGSPAARWDAIVRGLHWALAGAVVFNLVRDDGDLLHRNIGYWAAGVVVARLAWAVVSTGHGRWAALKPSPTATLAYVRALLRGSTTHPAGHDPLALWMVWTLWLLVGGLALTGWLSRTDAFWGDDLIHDLHAWLADGLLLAVVVHVGAVMLMSWRWGVNLVAGMVTGRVRGR